MDVRDLRESACPRFFGRPSSSFVSLFRILCPCSTSRDLQMDARYLGDLQMDDGYLVVVRGIWGPQSLEGHTPG